MIEMALQCGSPEPLEEGTIPIGFAHNTVHERGRQGDRGRQERRHQALCGHGRLRWPPQRRATTSPSWPRNCPQDHVILTAGCAKYRYNKLDLGDIGGIPRVLDAGQCNDSYSLVYIALQLAEAFGLEDINDLPISYDIAWYEQKAVIVLLALLSLGVKHIRLGPTLPAFVSPGVLKVLVEHFDIKPTTTVEEDLAQIVAGQ